MAGKEADAFGLTIYYLLLTNNKLGKLYLRNLMFSIPPSLDLPAVGRVDCHGVARKGEDGSMVIPGIFLKCPNSQSKCVCPGNGA